ncbi:MAG: chromate resistance protein [Nitrospirae bacterium]|nr:chromate resistance protein [Nitrospirota bacterium]
MLHKTSSRDNGGNQGWLLFFYSVPSKPVNARMKTWRRLAKAGAVQLKSAVYILPFNEENYELCQWLVSEVISMKGDGSFVSVKKIETMKDDDIIAVFNNQREQDYRLIEKSLEEMERKTNSVRKGAGIQGGKSLADQLNKHLREFEDIRKIDFFESTKGIALKNKFDSLLKEIKGLTVSNLRQVSEVSPRRIEDYQKKIWATRKRPFVDRMASAWLIKRFIDKKAVFSFIDEKDIGTLAKNTVVFDAREGEFTHIGDMCTFETLVRTFGIKDKPVRKIAELVHELDMKDGKYNVPEAKGIEDVLSGIRKTSKNDAAILEKGMAVFEMLYASKI